MSTLSVYVCLGCKTRIPFGTETTPAPSRCPGCHKRLYIPASLPRDACIEVTCPSCSTCEFVIRRPYPARDQRYQCRKCGAIVDVSSREPPTAEPTGDST